MVRVLSCLVLAGLAVNMAEVSAGKSELKSSPAKKYSIVRPLAAHTVAYFFDEITQYAKAHDSISAKELYDHIKEMRFEIGDNRDVIDACNITMSYFRAQDNGQSGEEIRAKLKDFIEAVNWLNQTRDNAKARYSNHLTDFRMVNILLTPEIYPHLKYKQRIMVLQLAKKYQDVAKQQELMTMLQDGSAAMISPSLFKNLKIAEDMQEQFDNDINKTIAIISINKNMSDAEIERGIIALQAELNQLKTKTYTVEGQSYTYSKTQRQALEKMISNRLSQLFLIRSERAR